MGVLSLFNAVLRTTSQSASQPAPLVGEPLASRETLSWTLEAQYGAKWRASLQRAAASGQCTLSSCRESRQRSTIASDKSSFVRPAWAWPICQGLPYQGSWQSRQALTERFSPAERSAKNKNRATGNVRTCGAVYLLEEIVLVNNNWLNPVWIIEIVYFIQRKKSTQVGKITNYNKKTP